MSKYLVKGNQIFNGVIPRYQNLVPDVLWNGTPTQNTIQLNKSVANYSYIEIFFHTNDGAGFRGSQKVISATGSGTIVASLQYIHVLQGNYYIKVKEVNISGTQISKNWTKEIYYNGMSDNDCIYITKVLGYK